MSYDNTLDTRIARLSDQRNIALAGSALTFLLGCISPIDAVAAGKYCSDTATALNRACGFDLQDNYWESVAICTNETDPVDRTECLAEADSARGESKALCKEQLQGRLSACSALGEGRYDPHFEPWLFDKNFNRLTRPNRYYPLRIGNRWEYWTGTRGVQSEFGSVEIFSDTKLIDEVTCIVARDLVYEADGTLIEATDDWYAQAKNGDVWYCGEEVKNYESFEGDQPKNPELVSIDGRFKADIDGAKPGIIFKAVPVVGQTYLEEFSLGNAEDIAQVFSKTYHFGEDKELDRFVPPNLAKLLCHHDCVVTENTSLLEPGVVERKYYAPGIGTFLETNPDSGEITRLVKCNFHELCASLPTP
ncbi:MAG: hypothetical protein WBM03_06115 [Steroidobacteraceae bacterium]